MVNLLFVGIGSAFGGIVRYWIGLHVKSGGSFPIATCIVNLVGSLLIGLLSGWLERSYSQSSLAPMIPLLRRHRILRWLHDLFHLFQRNLPDVASFAIRCDLSLSVDFDSGRARCRLCRIRHRKIGWLMLHTNASLQAHE